MKRCEHISLVIREIKTIMRYYFIPIRMVTIFKRQVRAGENVEKMEPSKVAGRNINSAATLEKSGSSSEN